MSKYVWLFKLFINYDINCDINFDIITNPFFTGLVSKPTSEMEKERKRSVLGTCRFVKYILFYFFKSLMSVMTSLNIAKFSKLVFSLKMK